MALPSGYTELEYIESTGAQYINTGVVPDTETVLEADIEITSLPSNAYVFCSRVRAANKAFGILAMVNNRVRLDYASSQATKPEPSTGRKNIYFSSTYCIYGEATNTFSGASLSSTLPIFIFGMNNNGAFGSAISMKLYSCKMTKAGVLHRDYVPCKNPGGSIGLYDLVEGKFYANAGSGNFMEGPSVEIKPETPSKIFNKVCVALEWGSVECDGYRLYKNGSLLVQLYTNSYVDYDVTDGEDITYSIKAYNSSYESDPVEITVSVREGYTVLLPVVNSAFFQ